MYIGNLEYSVAEKELEELFAEVGSVVYSKVILSPEGKSKGFGFVEMETEEQAKEATEKFNQSSFKERTIVVNEARPQTDRSSSGGERQDRGSYNPAKKVTGDLNYKLRKLRRSL